MDYFKQWFLISVKNKSLLKGFVVQDIRGRYAGSMGGLLWSVLVPAANMLIYIFVFAYVMKVRIGAGTYGTGSFTVFLLTGLLPWLAFSEAIGRAPSLIMEKSNLVTKVSFPVSLLPIVGTMTPFILNGIGLGIFLIYLFIMGYFSLTWFLLPIIIALHFMFTLGLVNLISALGVFVRDLQQLMGIVLTLWMYLTPILYPVSMVPKRFQLVFFLNPVYYFSELYHMALLRHGFSVNAVLVAVILSVTMFLFGNYMFMRIKHSFGDVL